MTAIETPSETKPTNEAPVVDVQSLHLVYPATRRTPEVTALNDVSLSIDAGNSVALLGPNGSGKSTLLRVVCGMGMAQRGNATLFGDSPTGPGRAHMGVVFQSIGLDPRMTVRENLRDSARLYGLDVGAATERWNMLLEHAGVLDRLDARVGTLSPGLARRVDLCRALLHEPELLLLDEPTTGLDPTARGAFMELVGHERTSRNMAVLMSTHLMDEAEQMERVVMMHDGCIVADGSPTSLRNDTGALCVTVQSETWEPDNTLVNDGQWDHVGDLWKVTLDDQHDAGALAALISDLVVQGLAVSCAPPTLEDVFAVRTGATLLKSDGAAS